MLDHRYASWPLRCASRRARRVCAVALALAASSCAGTSRFALRPPVTSEHDDRPFARRPHVRVYMQATEGIDVQALRPMSHAFRFTHTDEARNVNALDEVPDSTWFTNRAPSPAEAARGSCAADGSDAPAEPLAVLSLKNSGVTPGIVVRDARGRRYMLKVDQYHDAWPETSTGADVVVSRLYWAMGYNAPCNRIALVRPGQFSLAPGAFETDRYGHQHPTTLARVSAVLARGHRLSDGTTRVTASLFVEGEPIGPPPSEGTRDDDPNDVIPHQDRRELRAERVLAAWVNHWDIREQSGLDTFVRGADGRAGYVRHYMIDFSDALGAVGGRRVNPERASRFGEATLMDLLQIGADVLGLGVSRRPWDDARIDPRAPNLGFFTDVTFEVDAWRPLIMPERFLHARDEDQAWMARRIARLTPEHVRALVRTGEYSSASTAERLHDVLMGRRARILAAWFARRTPLDAFAVRDARVLCADDLGVTGAGNLPREVRYELGWRQGEPLERGAIAPILGPEDPSTPGRVCIALPPGFAPASAPADAGARYATLDIARVYRGTRTTMRAHFYDEGPARGYVLVGIER